MMTFQVKHAFRQTGLLVALSALLFTACNKDDNDSSAAVSEDEAAEVIAQSVSDESGGLSLQIEIAAKTASTSTLSCGASSDTSFSGASVSGAAISYSYSLQMSRTLTCLNNMPQLFSFNLTGQSSYEAPRMSSNDNTVASFEISGLEVNADAWTFNESYTRSGTQASKVRNQRSFASSLVITASDITVDKSTYKILSGSASVSFTGTSSGGSSVTYSGTITFLGGNTATLVLESGTTINLEW